MISTFRGHSVGRLRHLLAGAALFALLAPTAGLLVNAQLAGWASDHGHAGRVSALATHSHPYDNDHAVGADGQQATDGASDVTFTPSDDAGAAALVLAREPVSLPAGAAPTVATPVISTSPLGASADRVPTPPPRA